MTTTQQTSASVDIAEAFALAGLTTETSRWGHLQARIDADQTIRVTEDDGTFHVYCLTGGAAMLVTSEVQLSGRAANPVVLAVMIEALIA